MNFDSQCAERLKAERKRLGLNQTAIAELCGISREMWGKYERGVAVPGGEVLFALANNGGNVQYVLTGLSSGVALTADELELVQIYRAAPLAIKAAALAALTAGTTSASTQTINATGNNQRVAGRDYHQNKK